MAPGVLLTSLPKNLQNLVAITKRYIQLITTGLGFLGLPYFFLIEQRWTIDTGILEILYGVFGMIYAIVAGFVILVLLTPKQPLRYGDRQT